MKTRVEIAVAYHKPSTMVEGAVWLPLHVGKAAHPEVELGLQTDAEGENISAENGYYCELTGIYWLWKHSSAEYKGLCHYRRIFTTRRDMLYPIINCVPLLAKPMYSPNIKLADDKTFVEASRSASKAIEKIVGRYDVIAPHKTLSGRTCYSHFLKETGPELLALMQDIVAEKYPQYFKPLRRAFRTHRYYFGNMSVMRSELFDEYCTLMFGILEELKRRLIKQGWLQDLMHERIFARKLGYLGEVITHLYLQSLADRGAKLKHMYVAYLDK